MAGGGFSHGLAYIYAEALYGAVKEDHAVEATEQELLSLQEVFQRDDRIKRFIVTPAITAKVKEKVLRDVLKDFSTCTQNFLCLLIRKQRVILLDEIIRAFHDHCNREGGIAELELWTATPIDPAQKEKLKQVMQKKLDRTVILKERSKPELISGFVLRHEDRQWDTSLVHRLGRLVDKMEASKVNMGAWTEE